jgi:Tfp pilus assembly protein PilE
MELIVVVIIIGILAMIGLPQFFKVAERGRAAEGVSILGAVRSSEMRWASEHGTTTNVMANLDVTMPALIRYFNAPVLVGGINPNTAPGATQMVTIARNNTDNSGYGNYVLRINVDGSINCTAGLNNICQTLGYPAP